LSVVITTGKAERRDGCSITCQSRAQRIFGWCIAREIRTDSRIQFRLVEYRGELFGVSLDREQHIGESVGISSERAEWIVGWNIGKQNAGN
jgi:hypothetical protein